MEWVDWLLDTSGFVPRSYCGDWGTWLAPTYQVANTVIALCYMAIPFAIMILWWNRGKDLPKGWILPGFALLIFMCGKMHWLEVAVFWWPAYRLITFTSILTALASLPVAVTLPWVVHYLLRVQTPEQAAQIISELKKEQAKTAMLAQEQKRHAKTLATEADKLREQFETLKYQVITEEKYQALRRGLHDLRGA